MTAVTAMLLLLLATVMAGGRTGAQLGGDSGEEAAIMLQLRLSVHSWNRAWSNRWQGWRPQDRQQFCAWDRVDCDAEGHVVGIMLVNPDKPFSSMPSEDSLSPADAFPFGSGGGPGPLLPSLALLPRLDSLEVWHLFAALPAGIPREWCQPGAFPRLQRLVLSAHSLGRALPDIRPGALPALQHLQLFLPLLRSTLPPSWGLLPRLKDLSLELLVTGSLPAQWGRDMSLLRSLELRDPTADDRMRALQPPLTHPTGLPPQWGEGFPRLEKLSIANIQIGGPLPPEWAEGLPALRSLRLSGLQIGGTLPAQLLSRRMEEVNLWDNEFTGSLPEEWAAAHNLRALLLSGNQLAGPAFPPAWLEAGSMASLTRLELSYNPGLTGTLPASLRWPRLEILAVSSTNVTGSVPASWCQAPFNTTLTSLLVELTAISTSLPLCAASSLLNMQLALPDEYSPTDSNHTQAGASATVNPARGPALRASVAAVATLAVVMPAAGFWVAVQRMRNRRREQKLSERQQLLPSRREQQFGMTSSAARRAHLAERLRAEFGRQTNVGPGSIHSITVFPLDALPAALLHNLQSTDLAASSEAAPRPQVAGMDHLGGWGCAPGQAAAAAFSDSPHAEGAGGEAARRQWGLKTQGLRLQAEELQLITGADGSPVEVGVGGSAVVYLGRLKGVDVAVKTFELGAGIQSTAIWHEAQLLRSCCAHPRILPLLGIAMKGPLLLLVTALMQGGTLQLALQGPHRLQWRPRGRQVALDVAEALDFLHTQLQTRHSDLKSSNVLLSEDGRACVSDLGLAQFVGQGARSIVGLTFTHAAPEQLLGHRCTLAADVYSFGLVLVELTTHTVMRRRGQWRLPRAPEECPQAVLELIQACLSPIPEARPSAAEALRQLQAEAAS